MASDKITCPNCGTKIDIDDVLTQQTEERVKKEMQAVMASKMEAVKSRSKELEEQKQKFEETKQKENELFKARIKKEREEIEHKLQNELKEKERSIEAKTKETIQKEFQEKIKAQQEMLEQANAKNKELSQLEIKLMQTQQKLELQKQEAELEAAKKIQEAKKMGEIEAQKKEHEKWELKEKEWLKKLEDQKKLTEEMQRKQSQGSMQLQGEVQELAIEEYLAKNFAFDDILEIKKGARGGDCIQVVKNTLGHSVGKIYYESKRTKEFQPSWINKFKDDIREQSADVGVLITQAMPTEMERFGLYKGIWVCTYNDFKGLCFAIREGIIKVSEVKDSQQNKGDKMHMLYDYFTSQAFKDTFKNMMDVFTGMKEDLEKEKRAMTKIWSMRDKQIERYLANAQNMYGSIKGIAGNSADFLDELDQIGFIE